MIQLSLRKEIVLREIPEETDGWFIGSGDTPFCERPDDDYLCLRYNGTGVNIALPPGQWSIIGLCSEVTEEDWREIVKILEVPMVDFYYDYIRNDYSYSTASESALSLLKHHSLLPERTILIVKRHERYKTL